MRTVFFNDGQFKITAVGRGRYRLPIHTKNYPQLADPRFDLDHSVKQGPSDICRNAEARHEDYFRSKVMLGIVGVAKIIIDSIVFRMRATSSGSRAATQQVITAVVY
jgi:hypothetical protein